jgi:hypothetical protein
MAIKAVVLDESGTHHLILGLNRENVDSVVNGNVFHFSFEVPAQNSWCPALIHCRRVREIRTVRAM